MSSSSPSVIVVGGGPAGVTLAYLLASRGLEVTLLERQRDLAREFRGEILLPSGLEARVASWCMPGLLVIGDAAHTMSPVGGQGINIALRDAVVAANHLVPVLRETTEPRRIDAAARAIEAERTPELVKIQRIQAVPPKILMGHTWWGATLRFVLPRLLRFRFVRWRAVPVLRTILFGVGDVRLEV